MFRKRLLYTLGLFFIYTLFTAFLFSHRLHILASGYGMPDVDTEGGLWYLWFKLWSWANHSSLNNTALVGYPHGYDLSYIPFNNLINVVQTAILHFFTQGTIQDILFINNISSLLTYPLAGICAYLLCVYLTKNKLASFVGGFCYAFFHYFVLMGRGQMSINHIWPIPLYILSLCMFLDKRTPQRLIFSVLIFAFMFYADPYYAFFCGLVSPVIVINYGELTWRQLVKITSIYYSILLLFCVVFNADLVVKNIFLLNKESRVQSGRVSTARSELLRLTYWSSPEAENTLLSKYAPEASHMPKAIIISICIIGVIIIRKKYARTFISVYILTLILSHDIKPFYFINEYYFHYFDMFRSIARMVMISALCEAVLISAFIHTITKRKLALFFSILIVLLRIFELPVYNPSWLKNTDFTKREVVWKSLTQFSDKMNAVAIYPYSLGALTYGFPNTYQLLDQMLHKKPIVAGISPFDLKNIGYQKNAQTPNDSALKEFSSKGVDGIIIYNRLISKEESGMIKRLVNQKWLTKLASSSMPLDIEWTSTFDRSLDISLYKNMLSTVPPNQAKTSARSSKFDYYDNIASISRLVIVQICLVYWVASRLIKNRQK